MSFRSWTRNKLIRAVGTFKSPPEDTDEPVYRILAYHRIQAHETVSFRHQLDRLQKAYNFVTPDEFQAGAGETNTLNLLLTFDDGYLEWESQVLPELAGRGIRAVFFVCPDLVGLDGAATEDYCRDHLRLEPSLPLTEDGVDEILDRGHTLGNHLVRHEDLREEMDRDDVRRVLEESQKLFEERFDRRPDWLAYPFGDYFRNPEALRSCVKDYFNRAFTLVPGINREMTDSLFLRRDAFSPSYSPALESAWLAGGYDPLFRLTHLTKTIPG